MMNLERELTVLADLSDEDLARTYKFLLDQLAWLQYEKARREGHVSWTDTAINIHNPMKEILRHRDHGARKLLAIKPQLRYKP